MYSMEINKQLLEALFADLEDAEKQLQMTEKQKKESEKAKKSCILQN